MKVIAYSFAAALAASFIALLLGACVFGFQLAEWTEWQGRLVGIAATTAGIAGAVFGSKHALRTQR